VSGRIHWTLLGNTLLAAFLAGAAIRIFQVAMPTLASDLETDIVGVSWAVLAFQLPTIGLSLVFGKIGDICGRQRVLGSGYLVMMIGSLTCGISTSIGQLIAFRMIQGMGAAMTQSVGRAVAAEAMPEEKGGKAQGLMTTAFQIYTGGASGTRPTSALPAAFVAASTTLSWWRSESAWSPRSAQR